MTWQPCTLHYFEAFVMNAEAQFDLSLHLLDRALPTPRNMGKDHVQGLKLHQGCQEHFTKKGQSPEKKRPEKANKFDA